MLQKFEVQGIHMKVDDDMRNLVVQKIGRLDKYIPRNNRVSAHAEVLLKEGKTKNNNHCTCEVTMYLPHETIVVKESTVNMYVAIDTVATRLKQQLHKYKDLHRGGTMQRRLFARLSNEIA